MHSERRERTLRRLHLHLTAGWTLAWLLCVSSLGAVAVVTHERLSELDLESSLRLRATAVYGLTWFDAQGSFHDEVLRKEPGVLDEGVDVWVITPGPPARILLAPTRPRFALAEPLRLAATVTEREYQGIEEGRDLRGRRYRMHAKVTYDAADQPRAAILIVADPSARDAVHAAFVRKILLITAALAGFGLLVGNALSRRALRPVIASFAQQERFIASAAHELRAPVTDLIAVCETAGDGGSPEHALNRVHRIAGQTAGLVDKLLLLARLDSPNATLSRESLRLDLLVEAILPEDGSVHLGADASVVNADARLIQIAVRNLVENALLHGRPDASGCRVRVRVEASTVVVEDDGPGFPAPLMLHITEPFVSSASSPGAGLGLSIVQHIATLHDGELRLENRSPHGARAVLRLPADR